MTPEAYKQFRAFATQYGTIIGLIWTVSFACYIGGLTYPLLSTISFIFGISSPFIAFFLIRKFRNTNCEGVLSYGRAYWMSLLIFFYAALFTAMAQFIYFRFIDNGYVVSAYEHLLSLPEIKTSMAQLFPHGEVNQMMGMLHSISPIQVTFDLLSVNMIIGAILALPIALLSAHQTKTAF
jgi:hypothetical protein